jgi:hypothetical protein
MQLVEQGIPFVDDGNGGKEKMIGEIEENSNSDIEYLLSRLVIAEKALESANDKLSQISSKDLKNGQLRYEASTIIQEALQQIRGG